MEIIFYFIIYIFLLSLLRYYFCLLFVYICWRVFWGFFFDFLHLCVYIVLLYYLNLDNSIFNNGPQESQVQQEPKQIMCIIFIKK